MLRRHQQRRIAGGAVCKARLSQLGIDLGAASSGVDSGAAPELRGAARRHRVYSLMAEGLSRSSLRLGGEVTQGLKQDDLFEIIPPGSPEGLRALQLRRQRGAGPGEPPALVRPRLRRLDVPVRAVVLPMLDLGAAAEIQEAAAGKLLALLDESAVWWQDPGVYHATIYHASTHRVPVPATAEEVAEEAAAVARVAVATCPMRVALERVVATAGGVLVACWQVLPSSGRPEELRASLRHALPRAPEPRHQAIQELAMLHTTIARLLAPARRPAGAAPEPRRRRGREGDDGWRGGSGGGWRGGGGGGGDGWGAEVPVEVLSDEFAEVAQALTDELCGLEVTFDELWFVEEQDLLALALKGRYKKHQSLLKCREVGGNRGGGGSSRSSSSSV